MYALYIPSLKDKSHALEKQSRVSAVFKDRSNPAAARRSPKQMIVQLNAWVLKKFQVASNFTIFSCFKQSFQTRGFIWIYRIHHTSHVSKRVTRHVHNWLVVSTPLKNISQLGWLFPKYGKIKNVPNHHVFPRFSGVDLLRVRSEVYERHLRHWRCRGRLQCPLKWRIGLVLSQGATPSSFECLWGKAFQAPGTTTAPRRPS